MKCQRCQPDARGNRQPQRNRQRERHEQPPRLAHHREPLRKRLHESRDGPRQLRRQHALDAERPAGRAAPGGRRPRTRRPARRRRRPPRAARRPSRAPDAPDAPSSVAGSAVRTNTANSPSTVTRSSSRSRMMVANAAVAGKPFAPGQQIRPDHFAGAGRQQKRGGKADNRGAERVARSGSGRAAPAGTASGAPGARRSRR